MTKIPVYFVPGLASSETIFEYIQLPEQFECFYLSWDSPLPGESLRDYARRFSAKVKHPDPVLIGCSFGGILVQEMKAFTEPRAVIVISSAKSYHEYPRRFRLARRTRLHKLMPVSLLVNIDRLHRYKFNKWINERLRLYRKYIGIRDKAYWNWAIEQVIMWNREKPDPEVIHIHGTDDEVFPARYISNFIPVPGGTHIMVINRFKWFNEHLPAIINKAITEKNGANEKV